MVRRFVPFIMAAVILLGICSIAHIKQGESHYVFSSVRYPEEQLILDAGHGGEDGGAVSVTGVPESGINLSIAFKLDALCGLYGISPVLLRTEDISLHDDSATTIHEKKSSDLHNRADQVENTENATLISIHQNKFTNSSAHGAQVFYSNPDLSLALAQLTQEALRVTLDESNTRIATQIPNTVYLMNHISCRAILVECGFLSNPAEDKLLQSGEYQTKIATAILSAWLQYQRDE